MCCIGVGTGGPGGARPPQYMNQGGPGPPDVGAIKGILTVKTYFFSTFQPLFWLKHKFRLQNFLLCFTHFKNRHVHTYAYIYVTEKKLAPPQYQTSSYSTVLNEHKKVYYAVCTFLLSIFQRHNNSHEYH